MTNEKALKDALDAINSGMLDLSDIEPYIETIKEAIEKQIPKKPRFGGLNPNYSPFDGSALTCKQCWDRPAVGMKAEKGRCKVMREILFRGKRKDNGEWVEGFLIIRKIWSQTVYVIRLEDNGFDNYVEHEVIPETVGQYTGLTDKNGKKIFENGHIIIDNKTYKVTFNNAEYILTNIFNCDIITLKNNSIRGVFVDEI